MTIKNFIPCYFLCLLMLHSSPEMLSLMFNKWSCYYLKLYKIFLPHHSNWGKHLKKKKKKSLESFGRTWPNLLHSFIVDVIYRYTYMAAVQSCREIKNRWPIWENGDIREAGWGMGLNESSFLVFHKFTVNFNISTETLALEILLSFENTGGWCVCSWIPIFFSFT